MQDNGVARALAQASTVDPLMEQVSFGLDITKPHELETRPVSRLLDGILNCEWDEAVFMARVLDSIPLCATAAQKAKEKLPIIMWSGEFACRRNRSLIQHSGLLGIDLDDLDESERLRIMQAAVADQHCLAAYKSARGKGIRLVIRVPKVNAAMHRAIFSEAVKHVRAHYRAEPDLNGKDVCRASFVSSDGGLWMNTRAVILPVENTYRLHRGNLCVNAPPKAELPWWHWLALEHLPRVSKTDGHFLTHSVLVDLGKALALRADRERLHLRIEAIEEITKVWFDGAHRLNRPLRRTAQDYAMELMSIVSWTRKADWFHAAANKWIRWTNHPDYPNEPKARLMFAIERHCEEHGSREFFIACRDAASVTKTSHQHANKLLRELVRSRTIERLNNPDRTAREAFEYRLPGIVRTEGT